MASVSLTASTFAQLVDHTLLKAEATRDDIVALCAEAIELSTFSVCTNGLWTSVVAEELQGSSVAVCSVVGFPLGAMSPAAVAYETSVAVNDGAAEIDMVQPLGALIAGDDALVAAYVAAVRQASEGATLKVIIESAHLSDAQIVRSCEISVAEGADFVKTSTGFHASGGASVEAVALMRSTVGPDIGVKASGGIRSLADAQHMVDAGASRLGMSATRSVLDQLLA